MLLSSYRYSDLVGPPPSMPPPSLAVCGGMGTAVAAVPYGRGGPLPYRGGGPHPPFAGRGPVPATGHAYPTFQPPVGGFSIGRGERVANGHVGDRRGGRGGFSGRGREGVRGSESGSRGRGGYPGGGRGGGRGGSRGGSARGELDRVSLPRPEFGNLVPFEKNFYVESPSVRAMSEHEAMMYRAKRDITVEGHDVPKPIRLFQEANFPGISLCSNECVCAPELLI